MDGKNRKDIKTGPKVEIVLKKDQRTGKRTEGCGEGDSHKLLLPPSRDQGPAHRRSGGSGGEDHGVRLHSSFRRLVRDPSESSAFSVVTQLGPD